MSLKALLIERGMVTEEQVAKALESRKSPADSLEKTLMELGFVSERELIELRGEQLSIPFVDLAN